MYLGVRSLEKGTAALQKLKDTTGNEKVHIIPMDLADLFSVKQAAAEFQK